MVCTDFAAPPELAADFEFDCASGAARSPHAAITKTQADTTVAFWYLFMEIVLAGKLFDWCEALRACAQDNATEWARIIFRLPDVFRKLMQTLCCKLSRIACQDCDKFLAEPAMAKPITATRITPAGVATPGSRTLQWFSAGSGSQVKVDLGQTRATSVGK